MMKKKYTQPQVEILSIQADMYMLIADSVDHGETPNRSPVF